MYSEKELIIYLSFALLLTILIWSAVYRIREAHQNKLRERFSEQYGIPTLPDSIRVHTEKSAFLANRYYLLFPYWIYSRHDGCKDRRRRYNKIVWRNSSLEFQNWMLTSIYPYDLLEPVRELRHAGYQIEMTAAEEERLQELIDESIRNSHLLDAAGIYDEFIQNPRDFEFFCADLLEAEGWECTVTQATNDGGYDIAFYKGDETGIAECKCYAISRNIGRPLIQKLVGANVDRADRILFMTTSGFTSSAVEYANHQGVELIDGEQLAKMFRNMSLQKEPQNNLPDTYQLKISDMAKYVPSDIFNAYFENRIYASDDSHFNKP